jgi:hypothetical protein
VISIGSFNVFQLLSGCQLRVLLVSGNLGGLMSKFSLKNKLLVIMLFLSTFGMSLNINLGQGIEQKAIASYKPHEFPFVSGLSNLVDMSQERADEVCRNNFRELRQRGIFDENVERNTWHIWAHRNNTHCVINIRRQPRSINDSDWIPSNNRDKRFPIRIPRF